MDGDQVPRMSQLKVLHDGALIQLSLEKRNYMPDDDPRLFLFRNCVCSCVPQPEPGGTYSVHVSYLSGSLGPAEDLPEDAEPYSTEAEARRHGQQQAVRWANDRFGDGQDQF
jgi:hypothetical protein